MKCDAVNQAASPCLHTGNEALWQGRALNRELTPNKIVEAYACASCLICSRRATGVSQRCLWRLIAENSCDGL